MPFASTLQQAIEGSRPDVEALLHRLAVEEPAPEIQPDDVLALLVRQAAERAVAAINAQSRVSQTVVDLRWAKERIEALADPARRTAATAELVAWLSGSAEEEG